MSDTQQALLEGFIRSDVSPSGKWWVDVPTGLSPGEAGEHATQTSG
jgi:hypothetical protein